MNQSNKLIAAFAGGLLLASGAAFLWTRSAPPAPVVQVAEAPPPVNIDPAPAAVPEPEPKPADTSTAAPKRAAVKHVVAAKPHSSPTTSTATSTTTSAATGTSSTSTDAASGNGTGNSGSGSSQFGLPSAPAYNPASTPVKAPEPPHTVTIPAGTALQVRLAESLNSEHNATGDRFRATLTSPVVVNGFVIAERGANVEGSIVEAARSGRVQGRASMTLALASLSTTDHQTLSIQTDTTHREATSGVKGDTAKVAGGAAIGALIGALAGGGRGAGIGAATGGAAGTGVVLGTRGKALDLPVETALAFHLTSPVTVTEHVEP